MALLVNHLFSFFWVRRKIKISFICTASQGKISFICTARIFEIGGIYAKLNNILKFSLFLRAKSRIKFSIHAQ